MRLKPPFSRSQQVLAAVLLLSLVGLIYTRIRLNRNPPEPPSTAGPAQKTAIYLQRIKSDPTDARAYLELGKLDESQEFYSSALRRLYAARALGASEKEIILPLGRSLSHLARWDEAIKELTRATILLPDSVEAAANLAGAYYSSGSAGNASRALREFINKHRSADGVLTLKVGDLRRIMFCFSEAQDTQAAADIAREVIRLAPKDGGAYSIAGNALLLANRYDEAILYLSKAVSIEGNEAALRYNYGLALEHVHREDEAMTQFQKCVGLNPNATDGFIELGRLYEQRQDWKHAAMALSNAAFHSSKNHLILYRAAKVNERAGNLDEANYWYSSSALAAGQFAEALAYSQKLMSSQKSNWRSFGFRNAAQAYQGMHKMKEYLETIKQSAAGDSARDCLRLADAYESADLLDDQVKLLRRALGKEPRLAPVIHFSIAQTMIRRGSRDEAEAELAQAIAADPGNAEYHAQLGAVLFERRLSGDRLKRAIGEFGEAVRLNPQETSGFQSLGIAYAAAGDNRRAAFYLEHAIDLQPGNGPSYQELGRVYIKMGDKASSEAMMSLYRKYVRYDLKLKTLTAKADQNKRNAGAQIELADFMATAGDYSSAIQRYALALEISPNDRNTQRKYDHAMELLTRTKSKETAKQSAAIRAGGSPGR